MTQLTTERQSYGTIKYEDIYLKEYTTVPELEAGLDNFFRFYNQERSIRV